MQGGNQSFHDIRKLVHELNVLRRHVGSYPAAHPVVVRTLSRVHAFVETLIPPSGRLVLGITKETILVNEDTIDLADPAILNFARSLFSYGIIAVTFDTGVSADELLRFNQFLMELRQDAAGEDGVAARWQKAGFEHIHIEVIDYQALSGASLRQEMQTEPQGDFWVRFVRGVLAGTITGASADAVDIDAEMMEGAPPEMLAEILQEQAVAPSGETLPAVLKLLAQFLKRVDEKDMTADPRAVSKFIRFLDALKPEVRDYFLKGSFDALVDRPAVSEKLIEFFPGGMLVDALNKGLNSSAYAPPAILDVLRRLVRSRHLQGAHEGGAVVGGAQDIPASPAEMDDHLRVLLKEEDSIDAFVPEEYQETLRMLAEEGGRSLSDEQEIATLRETLHEHDIDVSFSHVLLELLDVPIDGQQDNDALRQNLLELCGYFVRTGEFTALTAIFDRAQRLERGSDHAQVVQQAFVLPDFVDEVLRGPVIWGKQKFDDIAVLIRRIGEPFLNPMLDRLAEEQNLSLRRFYVDRIVEAGQSAVSHVGARLMDQRWFYVRNLVVILRNIGSPAAVPFLKALQTHQHAKVRHEVLRALVQFHDNGGYAMIADELDSDDAEVLMSAIRISVQHHDPVIIRKLVALVEKDGLSDEVIEIRAEALRSLGGIGDTSCLPAVERILRSRNFFRQTALNRLKEELVRSLGAFRVPEARTLLQEIRNFGSRDLVRLAEDVLRTQGGGYGN